jgi:hypothetical protein
LKLKLKAHEKYGLNFNKLVRIRAAFLVGALMTIVLPLESIA